jgi:hypothetical protein
MTFPVLSYPTMEGTILFPLQGMITGFPPSIIDIAELVVPRSIPDIRIDIDINININKGINIHNVMSNNCYSILFYSILSYPILSYPVLTHPILSCPNLSYPNLSYPVLTYPILSYPVLSNPILSVILSRCTVPTFDTLHVIVLIKISIIIPTHGLAR